MRLSNLKIENHSRLVNPFEIEVRDHLVLVGANEAGKSSVLRCLDLLLGCTISQLYSRLSSKDFKDPGAQLSIEAVFVDLDSDEKAAFPNASHLDPDGGPETLRIRLVAEIDDQDMAIKRNAPDSGTDRSLNKDQFKAIGWKYLGSKARRRDIEQGRRSALEEVLENIDLGEELEGFKTIEETVSTLLAESIALGEMRETLSDHLSQALPSPVDKDDLTFVPGETVDDNALSNIRLKISKNGASSVISDQSDGTRALFAISIYNMASSGANVVAIDEPETHLHPSSQRNMARLLKGGGNQKVIATHSEDIVSEFDPQSIVVIQSGGVPIQPPVGFLTDDEKRYVRWWVRSRLEALTSRAIIAVEGISDRIVLEKIAELKGVDLCRLGVSVIEAGGVEEMGPVITLFGSQGFDIPLYLLIDLDGKSEDQIADKLRIPRGKLAENRVWISKKDLEEECAQALGALNWWSAIKASGYFSNNVLANCVGGEEVAGPSIANLSTFCRKSKRKVYVALVASNLMTLDLAKKVSSVNKLLDRLESEF